MSVADETRLEFGRARATLAWLDGWPGWLVYIRTMSVCITVWAILSLIIGNRLLLPSPVAVFQAIWDVASSGDLLNHGVTSLTRLLVALVLAAIAGLPLGLMIGLSRLWKNLFELPIEMLRPIAGIAWIPLALFIFGIGNRLPVFIMFYTAVFPLILGTAAGVRRIDQRLIDAARTMGVSRADMMLRVIVPAALPGIVVSMRIATAAAWTAVVAAELVGAPSGLGYAIDYYRSMLATDHVLAFIAMIGFLGFLTDWLLRKVELWVAPWTSDRGAE